MENNRVTIDIDPGYASLDINFSDIGSTAGRSDTFVYYPSVQFFFETRCTLVVTAASPSEAAAFVVVEEFNDMTIPWLVSTEELHV